jgi:hypothetical protein
MNLAVHALELLAGLHDRNQTACWGRRGIVAWAPPGCVRARAGIAAPLVRAGFLRPSEIAPRDAGFFDIFRQRLRGLAHREEALLFLAVQTGSVVLAGEPVVVEQAMALGLRVWAGEATQLDALFPLRPPAPVAARPPAAPPIPPLDAISSDEFPSARQVPALEEPTPTRERHNRPGRAGSLRACRRRASQPLKMEGKEAKPS